PLHLVFFFLTICTPPRSPLFPYTTLFRSSTPSSKVSRAARKSACSRKSAARACAGRRGIARSSRAFALPRSWCNDGSQKRTRQLTQRARLELAAARRESARRQPRARRHDHRAAARPPLPPRAERGAR